MNKAFAMAIGILTICSAQAKTMIYSSAQWFELKKNHVELLKGIVVNPGQKMKVDLSSSGQIVNLSVFDEKAMIQPMIDGHLE